MCLRPLLLLHWERSGQRGHRRHHLACSHSVDLETPDAHDTEGDDLVDIHSWGVVSYYMPNLGH